MNVERDARKEEELGEQGWDVKIVWECETRDIVTLSTQLAEWLAEDLARTSSDHHGSTGA